MSGKDESLAKPIGQGFHDSFVEVPESLAHTYYGNLISREQELADITLADLKHKKYDTSKLAHPEKLPVQSLDIALGIASIETAFHENEYPLILSEIQQFPALYRFLRSAELYHRVPRGGNTLMLGSGITVPEYLAQYIKPQDRESIDSCLKASHPEFLVEALKSRLAKANNGEFYTKPVNLLSGNAFALEPNPRALQEIDGIKAHFGIPDKKITIIPETLSDAIINGLIPNYLDTILWHRAEPRIASLANNQPFNQMELESLLSILKTRLVRGGRMIITVGGGNNEQERDERKQFLQSAQKVLPQLGFTQVTRTPLFFEEGMTKAMFGDEALGMLGGFIVKKN